MELCETLTMYRVRRGMSIDDLVKASGVARGTLTKILSGANSNPQIETLKSIVYALGITLDDLDPHDERSTITGRAINVALHFDELDEYGKRAIEALLKVEEARCCAADDAATTELMEQMRLADQRMERMAENESKEA